MKSLTSEELQSISEVIAAAEKKTSAEILPMVVKDSASESQRSLHLFLASSYQGLIILSVLWVLLILQVQTVYSVVVALISLGCAFLFFLYLHKLLKAKTSEDVLDRAIREFKDSGVLDTVASTGVFLFVSLREKRVVVLADKSIDLKAQEDTWLEVVEKTIDGIKEDSLASGLKKGIEALGNTLEKICPLQEGDVNEIKNEVVVKD